MCDSTDKVNEVNSRDMDDEGESNGVTRQRLFLVIVSIVVITLNLSFSMVKQNFVPEPFHTDLHSALSLHLSTNKTKVSREALWLGSSWGTLTDNTGHFPSNRKGIILSVDLAD